MDSVEPVEIETDKEEDFEMVLLAIAVIASVLLGYKNKARIKKWFDAVIGNFK